MADDERVEIVEDLVDEYEHLVSQCNGSPAQARQAWPIRRKIERISALTAKNRRLREMAHEAIDMQVKHCSNGSVHIDVVKFRAEFPQEQKGEWL